MDEETAVPSSLEKKLEELIQRVSFLEGVLSQQTQRIYTLERHFRIVSPEAEKAAASLSTAPAPLVSKPTPVTYKPPPPTEVGASLARTPLTEKKESKSSDLEARIGGNWLLWVGIIAIVLGTVYFLKLAFENNWVGPSVRVAIGVMFGTGFVYWGEALQTHKYPRYGQTVTGGGIAILYLSIYAAVNFYRLVPSAAAFAFMIVVTASVAVLAARYTSLVLAFIGLIGGFLTPYWLSTGEDHQIVLLSYTALLAVGVATLARVRRWMILNYSSFVLTILTFVGWATKFYTQDMRDSTEFFLVLLTTLFFYIFFKAYQQTEAAERSNIRGVFVLTGLLFYFASFFNLLHHSVAMFSFVILFGAALLIAALRIRLSMLGFFGFLVNALALAPWLIGEYRDQELVSTLAFVTVIFALYLVWPLLFVLKEKIATSRFDLMLTMANGLGYFGALYFLLTGHYHGLLGPLAVVMGAIYFVTAHFIWKRMRDEKRFALIALGVAITFVTLAIPIQLKQNWITLSWAVEAVVLAWVAGRTSSLRLFQGAQVVMGLVVLRLFVFDVAIAREDFQLVFNKRFFTFLVAILASYGMAWLIRAAGEELRKSMTRALRALIFLASFLTVVMLSMEASTFYQLKTSSIWEQMRVERRLYIQDAEVLRNLESAKQLAYSVIWGIYSVTLIVIGFVKRFRDIRLFAIGLFALTIAKVFFVDLKSLERVYRVVSIIGLGTVLLLAAFLYQRYRKVLFEP